MGHSALIFLYFVWPEAAKQNKSLKKPPRLNADTDFRYKSPIGVLFNDNLSVFETPLLDVGAKKVKVSGDGGENVIAYKLAKAVPEQEFWDVKEREELEWSKANVIITPKAAYPVLAVDIQELAKTIFFVTRSMPTVNRDYFGVDMLFLSKRLATSLIMAERGHGSFEEFFEIAPGLVSELFANISLISVFRLVDQKVLIRLTDALMKIEKDLKSARADYVKRRSEATKD